MSQDEWNNGLKSPDSTSASPLAPSGRSASEIVADARKVQSRQLSDIADTNQRAHQSNIDALNRHDPQFAPKPLSTPAPAPEHQSKLEELKGMFNIFGAKEGILGRDSMKNVVDTAKQEFGLGGLKKTGKAIASEVKSDFAPSDGFGFNPVSKKGEMVKTASDALAEAGDPYRHFGEKLALGKTEADQRAAERTANRAPLVQEMSPLLRQLGAGVGDYAAGGLFKPISGASAYLKFLGKAPILQKFAATGAFKATTALERTIGDRVMTGTIEHGLADMGVAHYAGDAAKGALIPGEESTNVAVDAGKGFRRWGGNQTTTSGYVSKLLGFQNLGDDMIAEGERQNKGFESTHSLTGGWSDLLDPYYWAGMVGENAPTSLMFMPLALAGNALGSTAAGAMKLGSFGTKVMEGLGVGMLSSPLEAAMEAGNTYEDKYKILLGQGKTKEEAQAGARHAAGKDFWGNMALLGVSNVAEFEMVFGPAAKKGLTNIIGTAMVEGGQEMGQQAIQDSSEGKKVNVFSPDYVSQGIFGALMGGGTAMAAGGGEQDYLNSISKNMFDNMSDEDKADTSEALADAKAQGIPEEQAKEIIKEKYAGQNPDAVIEATQRMVESERLKEQLAGATGNEARRLTTQLKAAVKNEAGASNADNVVAPNDTVSADAGDNQVSPEPTRPSYTRGETVRINGVPGVYTVTDDLQGKKRKLTFPDGQPHSIPVGDIQKFDGFQKGDSVEANGRDGVLHVTDTRGGKGKVRVEDDNGNVLHFRPDELRPTTNLKTPQPVTEDLGADDNFVNNLRGIVKEHNNAANTKVSTIEAPAPKEPAAAKPVRSNRPARSKDGGFYRFEEGEVVSTKGQQFTVTKDDGGKNLHVQNKKGHHMVIRKQDITSEPKKPETPAVEAPAEKPAEAKRIMLGDMPGDQMEHVISYAGSTLGLDYANHGDNLEFEQREVPVRHAVHALNRQEKNTKPPTAGNIPSHLFHTAERKGKLAGQPIVMDEHGNVLEGFERLREAEARGDEKIQAYVRVPHQREKDRAVEKEKELRAQAAEYRDPKNLNNQSWLEQKKLKELELIARFNAFPHTGTKVEIIARITNLQTHLEEIDSMSHADLMGKTVDQLKSLLKTMGERNNFKKDSLVRILLSLNATFKARGDLEVDSWLEENGIDVGKRSGRRELEKNTTNPGDRVAHFDFVTSEDLEYGTFLRWDEDGVTAHVRWEGDGHDSTISGYEIRKRTTDAQKNSNIAKSADRVAQNKFIVDRNRDNWNPTHTYEGHEVETLDLPALGVISFRYKEMRTDVKSDKWGGEVKTSDEAAMAKLIPIEAKSVDTTDNNPDVTTQPRTPTPKAGTTFVEPYEPLKSVPKTVFHLLDEKKMKSADEEAFFLATIDGARYASDRSSLLPITTADLHKINEKRTKAKVKPLVESKKMQDQMDKLLVTLEKSDLVELKEEPMGIHVTGKTRVAVFNIPGDKGQTIQLLMQQRFYEYAKANGLKIMYTRGKRVSALVLHDAQGNFKGVLMPYRLATDTKFEMAPAQQAAPANVGSKPAANGEHTVPYPTSYDAQETQIMGGRAIYAEMLKTAPGKEAKRLIETDKIKEAVKLLKAQFKNLKFSGPGYTSAGGKFTFDDGKTYDPHISFWTSMFVQTVQVGPSFAPSELADLQLGEKVIFAHRIGNSDENDGYEKLEGIFTKPEKRDGAVAGLDRSGRGISTWDYDHIIERPEQGKPNNRATSDYNLDEMKDYAILNGKTSGWVESKRRYDDSTRTGTQDHLPEIRRAVLTKNKKAMIAALKQSVGVDKDNNYVASELLPGDIGVFRIVEKGINITFFNGDQAHMEWDEVFDRLTERFANETLPDEAPTPAPTQAKTGDNTDVLPVPEPSGFKRGDLVYVPSKNKVGRIRTIRPSQKDYMIDWGTDVSTIQKTVTTERVPFDQVTTVDEMVSPEWRKRIVEWANNVWPNDDIYASRVALEKGSDSLYIIYGNETGNIGTIALKYDHTFGTPTVPKKSITKAQMDKWRKSQRNKKTAKPNGFIEEDYINVWDIPEKLETPAPAPTAATAQKKPKTLDEVKAGFDQGFDVKTDYVLIRKTSGDNFLVTALDPESSMNPRYTNNWKLVSGIVNIALEKGKVWFVPHSEPSPLYTLWMKYEHDRSWQQSKTFDSWDKADAYAKAQPQKRLFDIFDYGVNPNKPTAATKQAESQSAPTSEAPNFLQQSRAFLENWADETIKKNKNNLSSMPLDTLTAYAVKGAFKIVDGTVDFVKWSSEMLSEYGTQIKPFLGGIYGQAQAIIGMNQEELDEMMQPFGQAIPKAEAAPAPTTAPAPNTTPVASGDKPKLKLKVGDYVEHRGEIHYVNGGPLNQGTRNEMVFLTRRPGQMSKGMGEGVYVRDITAKVPDPNKAAPAPNLAIPEPTPAPDATIGEGQTKDNFIRLRDSFKKDDGVTILAPDGTRSTGKFLAYHRGDKLLQQVSELNDQQYKSVDLTEDTYDKGYRIVGVRTSPPTLTDAKARFPIGGWVEREVQGIKYKAYVRGYNQQEDWPYVEIDGGSIYLYNNWAKFDMFAAEFHEPTGETLPEVVEKPKIETHTLEGLMDFAAVNAPNYTGSFFRIVTAWKLGGRKVAEAQYKQEMGINGGTSGPAGTMIDHSPKGVVLKEVNGKEYKMTIAQATDRFAKTVGLTESTSTQAPAPKPTPAPSGLKVIDVLKSLKRNTKLTGEVPDPVAQDILKAIGDHAAALNDFILSYWADWQVVEPLGAGAGSVVLSLGDNRVARIGVGEYVQDLPKSDLIVLRHAMKMFGNVRVEIYPKLDTSNITEADVATMTKKLNDEGFDFVDPGTDNLGRTKDGTLKVIDPGAVKKRGVAAPTPAPAPKLADLIAEAKGLRVPSWGTIAEVTKRIEKARRARTAIDGKSKEELESMTVDELEKIMLDADMLPTEGREPRNKENHVRRLMNWRDGTNIQGSEKPPRDNSGMHVEPEIEAMTKWMYDTNRDTWNPTHTFNGIPVEVMDVGGYATAYRYETAQPGLVHEWGFWFRNHDSQASQLKPIAKTQEKPPAAPKKVTSWHQEDWAIDANKSATFVRVLDEMEDDTGKPVPLKQAIDVANTLTYTVPGREAKALYAFIDKYEGAIVDENVVPTANKSGSTGGVGTSGAGSSVRGGQSNGSSTASGGTQTGTATSQPGNAGRSDSGGGNDVAGGQDRISDVHNQPGGQGTSDVVGADGSPSVQAGVPSNTETNAGNNDDVVSGDEGESTGGSPHEDVPGFVAYVPSRIAGVKHLGDVVEPHGLSLVAYPDEAFSDKQYAPHPDLFKGGEHKLSDIQLEVVALSKYNFAQDHRGMLIADDTGVGKTGSQLGIAADAIKTGRAKRVLIVTKNDSVVDGFMKGNKEFGLNLPITAVNSDTHDNFKNDHIPAHPNTIERMQKDGGKRRKEYEDRFRKNPWKPLPVGDGVMAMSYTTFSEGDYAVRDWLEKAGGDVIVMFDESHVVKNVAGKAHVATAARDLFSIFKDKGQFIYSSATVSEEIGGMEHLYGLKLWGVDGFNDFRAALQGSDSFAERANGPFQREIPLVMMEQIVRELKQRGQYVGRSLSMEGITMEGLPIELSAQVMESWSKAAEFVQQIASAVEESGGNRNDVFGAMVGYMRRLRSYYTMKAIIDQIKSETKKGKIPRYALSGFFVNDESAGGEVGSNKMLESAIAKVRSLDAREELMAALRGADRVLPNLEDPVAMLVKAFGENNVGVISGKIKEKARIEAATDFQTGKKRIIYFTEAGNTGINLHDLTGEQITFAAVDYPYEATKMKQAEGRVNRTGQKTKPRFLYPFTQAAADKKFVGTLRSRYEAMGALSRGKSVDFGGESLGNFDFSGRIAEFAVDEAITMLSPEERIAMFGAKGEVRDNEDEEDAARRVQNGLGDDPVKRFLNLMMMLNIDMGNSVFDKYVAAYQNVKAAVERHGGIGTKFDVYGGEEQASSKGANGITARRIKTNLTTEQKKAIADRLASAKKRLQKAKADRLTARSQALSKQEEKLAKDTAKRQELRDVYYGTIKPDYEQIGRKALSDKEIERREKRYKKAGAEIGKLNDKITATEKTIRDLQAGGGRAESAYAAIPSVREAESNLANAQYSVADAQAVAEANDVIMLLDGQVVIAGKMVPIKKAILKAGEDKYGKGNVPASATNAEIRGYNLSDGRRVVGVVVPSWAEKTVADALGAKSFQETKNEPPATPPAPKPAPTPAPAPKPAPTPEPAPSVGKVESFSIAKQTEKDFLRIMHSLVNGDVVTLQVPDERSAGFNDMEVTGVVSWANKTAAYKFSGDRYVSVRSEKDIPFKTSFSPFIRVTEDSHGEGFRFMKVERHVPIAQAQTAASNEQHLTAPVQATSGPVSTVTPTPRGGVAPTQAQQAVSTANTKNAPHVPLTGNGPQAPTTLTQATPYTSPILLNPPLSTTEAIKKSKIIAFIALNFKVSIDTGKIAHKRALGVYKGLETLIRTKNFGDFVTMTHELGHHFDKQYGFSSDISLDDELTALTDRLTGMPRNKKGKPTYPPEQVRREGAAEFVRLYLYEPQVALQEAPLMFQSFENALRNSGKLGKMAELYNMLRTWHLQGARQQIQGVTESSPEDRFQGWEAAGDKFLMNWIDDYTGFNLPFERHAKEHGHEQLQGKNSPYHNAWASRGVAGKIMAFIENGPRDLDGERMTYKGRIVKPLKEILSKENVPDFKLFKDYLMALRAKELVGDQGRTKTPINQPAYDAIIDAVETSPDGQKYVDARDQLYDFQDLLLDVLVESHVMSASAVSQMRREHIFYVPFYRVMEDHGAIKDGKTQGKGSAGFANGSTPIKGMNDDGSARNIIDPIESIFKNVYLFMSLAAKNPVGVVMHDWANTTEYSAELLTVQEPQTRIQTLTIGEIAKTIENAGFDVTDPNINWNEIATVFRQSFVPDPVTKTVRVWVLGHPKLLKINNELLYQSVAAMSETRIDSTAWKIAKSVNTITKSGYTLSPVFLYKSFWRGALNFAVMTSHNLMKSKNPVEFVKLMGSFYGAMGSAIMKDERWAKWDASGGAQASLTSVTDSYARVVQDQVLRKDKSPIRKAAAKTRLGIEKWRHFISATTDDPFRMMEYERVMKETNDPVLAAVKSRDLDIDFAKGGKYGRRVNDVNSFFNVGLQGPNKVVREFNANKKRFITRGLVFVSLPAMLLYAMNQGDDDYWALPQWERDLFFIVPTGLPGKWKFLKIPIPFELGLIFKVIPERIAGGFQGKGWFNGFGATAGSTLIPTIVPAALEPAVEWFTGIHTFNLMQAQPIVPLRLQNKAPEDQYTAATSDTARAIAGSLGLSPMKVENLITGVTGSLGQMGLQGLDKIWSTTGITNPPSKPSGSGVFGASGMLLSSMFTSPEAKPTQYVEDFYAKLNAAENAHSRDTRHKGHPPKELRDLRTVKNQLAAIRTMRELTLTSEKLTSDQKRNAVDELNLAINDLAAKTIGKPMKNLASARNIQRKAIHFISIEDNARGAQTFVDRFGRTAK